MTPQKASKTRVPGPDEIARKLSLAAAFELGAECAGFDLDKQACAAAGIDRGRWARIKAGTEGIKWEQLEAFMDGCGNDVPVLWMLAQRGYDLHSLRRCETALEEENRLLRETLAREREEHRLGEEILRRVLNGGAPANG